MATAEVKTRSTAVADRLCNAPRHSKVIQNYTTKYGVCMFLLAFHHNYVSTLYHI